MKIVGRSVCAHSLPQSADRCIIKRRRQPVVRRSLDTHFFLRLFCKQYSCHGVALSEATGDLRLQSNKWQQISHLRAQVHALALAGLPHNH